MVHLTGIVLMEDNSGFEDERRVNSNNDDYYEKKFRETILYIGPGEFECSIDPNLVLASKVGSGIVICIYDPEVGVGGLAQIVMPERLVENFPVVDHADPAYENTADLIFRFINAIKRHGAGKHRIRIKMFGGSSIIEELVDSGLKNYVFAKEWLLEKGLMITNEDVGGEDCRRIFLNPTKGKSYCYKMRRDEDIRLLRQQETEYMELIK